MSSILLTAQSPAKSVYFELGGPGLASFNYDMRFNKTEGGLGFRAGVGGFSLSDDYDGKVSVLLFPVGLNYLMGKDSKNYFEIGAGVSIISGSSKFEDESETLHSSFGYLHFGYRLQPKNGGFTFRAGMTPIFNKNGFVPYYASISFGYAF